MYIKLEQAVHIEQSKYIYVKTITQKSPRSQPSATRAVFGLFLTDIEQNLCQPKTGVMEMAYWMLLIIYRPGKKFKNQRDSLKRVAAT